MPAGRLSVSARNRASLSRRRCSSRLRWVMSTDAPDESDDRPLLVAERGLGGQPDARHAVRPAHRFLNGLGPVLAHDASVGGHHGFGLRLVV
jgi:hypothetical protein